MMRGLGYQSHHFAPGTSGATLNFNFLNDGLDPRITFTRASTATYFNSAGTLTTASIDAARFDYNPSTLAAQGLLIEEQRTNSIRNNTMQGAVAGTPGTLPTNWVTFTTLTGITRTVVGTGTENGIAYVDIRLNGTPSAAGNYSIQADANNNAAASVGQSWTGSSYCKLVAGSTAGITAINNTLTEWNAAIAFLAGAGTPISLTGTLQRVAVTRTLTQATTAFVSNYYDIILTGAAIDITLRIGLPQLEQGAFATSVIPTTTTALTRSADVASVNTLSPWFNSTASTLYAEWTNIASAIPTGVTQVTAEIGEVTANNFYRIFTSQLANAKSSQQMFSGGVNPGRIDSGGAYSNATVKAASAFAAADRAISANGAAATTSAVGPLPVGVTTFGIGTSVGGGNSVNGWLRRITYYPRRLSNAELQAITA